MDKDNTRAQANSAGTGDGAAAEMDYIADLVADDMNTAVESSSLAQDEVVFLGEPDPKPADVQLASCNNTDDLSSDGGNSALTIELPARVSIKDIYTLKDTLSCQWSEQKTMTIDAGEVDSIDTASLQLLVAAVNSAKTHDVTVAWKSVSDKLRDLAAIVDLSRFLNLDQVVEEDNEEESDGLVPVF